jgi:PhzF family phenazine biosynthesis protein
MPPRLFHVDAFTDRCFAGNPAAVCLLDANAPERWMQDLAAELHLPATAFVTQGTTDRLLRWFTPAQELTLCGHATLATAHVLFAELGEAGDVARFSTVAGELSAHRGGDGTIDLDLPADTPEPVDHDETLIAALHPDGGAATNVVNTARGARDVLVELGSATAVRACTPDLAQLAAVRARCVIITAPGDGDADIVSRVFAPSVGIPEDPVTGSAHCLLGPYWAPRLGRNRLVAHQASARGGTLVVDVRDARVGLTGQAVTVAEIALRAGPPGAVT